MHMLFISGAEIFFIFFLVVIIFGTDRLPEIVRGLAKGMRQLKDAADDVKREIQKSAEKSGIDSSITDELKSSAQQVKKSVEEVTGTIKRQ
jgi:sec-independent protein translocase protein TatA